MEKFNEILEPKKQEERSQEDLGMAEEIIAKMKKRYPNDPHLINIKKEDIKIEDVKILEKFEQILEKVPELTEEEYNEFFNEFVTYRYKAFEEIREQKTRLSRLDFIGSLGNKIVGEVYFPCRKNWQNKEKRP